MQVAQAAFAVLDIGLDQIAGLSGASVALLALGKLGGDKIRGRALHDLLIEAGDQFVVELAIAEKITGLEHRRAHGHVGFGLPNALGDGARSMADLETHVPEAIEDRLGHRFAPGGLLVRKQEQEIDVGSGCQHAAAVAASGDDGHALGFRGVPRRIEMLAREFIQHADDLVLHEAQPLGAAAATTVLDEQTFGRGAAPQESRLETARDR